MASDAYEIIKLHTTSSRRWCMSCKIHVTDSAQHLIDKLSEAGYEIRKDNG